MKKILAEKQVRKIIVTAPKAIKKRRGTLTETEFLRQKQNTSGVNKNDREEVRCTKGTDIKLANKNERAERLRELEERKRAQREANGECSNEPSRKIFKPKVKNTTVSRASLLSSDMLMSDTK